nr:PAAR domain-containing protein [Pseudomonas sp. LB-090624]
MSRRGLKTGGDGVCATASRYVRPGKCSAAITSGSALMMDEGQPLARVGDATRHGGILENGDSSRLLD